MTDGNYEEYFKDDKNVMHELREARKAFAKGTTFDQYENLIKGLAIMLLHCNESIAYMVEATLNEAATRQAYAVTGSLRGVA